MTHHLDAAERRGGLFAEQLDLLFIAAGSPTLRQAARHGSSPSHQLTQQRISDWRRGKNRPASFARVSRLIQWLIERAEQQAGGTGRSADAVLSLATWERLLAEDVPDELPTIMTPFRGSASFRAEDHEIYFGRNTLVRELGDMVGRVHRSDEAELVVVTGASGAGTSSLLGAGLVRDHRIPAITRVVMNAAQAVVEIPASDAEWRVVVLDQFERIFALADADLAMMLARVGELVADPTVVVVVGMRIDFLEACARIPLLERSCRRNVLVVSEMDDAELRQAISGPIRHVGGRVDADLADVVIADVHASTQGDRRAGLLPLVAHMLLATWQQSGGNRMTVGAYLAAGGIEAAVAAAGESAWADLDSADQALARELLLEMTFVGPMDSILRNPIDRATLVSPDAHRVIDVLARARLVTVTREHVTLVHDLVLTGWPRLVGWLADAREAKSIRQRVTEDARDWFAADQDSRLLYRGAQLRRAYDAAAVVRSVAEDPTVEFLSAAERRMRSKRRLLSSVAALVIAAVLAVSALLVHDTSVETRQRNEVSQARLQAKIANQELTDPAIAKPCPELPPSRHH